MSTTRKIQLTIVVLLFITIIAFFVAFFLSQSTHKSSSTVDKTASSKQDQATLNNLVKQSTIISIIKPYTLYDKESQAKVAHPNTYTVWMLSNLTNQQAVEATYRSAYLTKNTVSKNLNNDKPYLLFATVNKDKVLEPLAIAKVDTSKDTEKNLDPSKLSFSLDSSVVNDSKAKNFTFHDIQVIAQKAFATK